MKEVGSLAALGTYGMAKLVVKLLRWLFQWIDILLMGITNLLYSGLLKLASLNIINTETLKSFGQRLGLILGLFMLFNVAINLLTYIVSPDKFADKSKGGAKLLFNCVLSLVLLGTVNIIFSTAYKFQYAVLDKQIIPQIIFGTQPKSINNDSEISYYLLTGLMTINPDVDTQGDCRYVYVDGIDESCEDFLYSYLDEEDYYRFEEGVETKDSSKIFTFNILNTEGSGGYLFDYSFLFSSVVFVIIILMLFNFCLDIAKRAAKLYFLQLIAPIPIISNMIPGKGQETFKKWYKACFATYADVFIRLVALFFAVYLITIVYQSIGAVFVEHKILGIFVILGALMFAKELPQLIQDMTGLKLDGGFSLNPLKKIQQAPLAAGLIGYAGARLGGAAANIWGTAVNNTDIKKRLASEGLTDRRSAEYRNRFKELGGKRLAGYAGSAIAGSHSAGIRSFWAGATGGGNKSIGQLITGGISGASLARNQRTAGYNLGSKLLDYATDYAKIKNDYGTTDKLKGKTKDLQISLANAKRNEQMYAEMFGRKLNEMETKKSGTFVGLKRTFDDAIERKPDGSFKKYQEKTYDDYLNSVNLFNAMSKTSAWSGKTEEEIAAAWESLDEMARQTEIQRVAAEGIICSRQEFDSINELYKARNTSDEQGRAFEKQIKAIEEDMRQKQGK